MTAPHSNGVLHGYIREHLFMTPNEHADLVARIVALAEREGYTLGRVYTEKLETIPDAFHALMQAVVDDNAAAVAVPTLHHLAVFGPPAEIRDHLVQAVGVPVVLSGTTP